MSEKKLAIIATKGSLDWAYPPFILASTAAALGYEVQVFFTFYGLQLLRKKLDLKLTSLGNPGMPMPMPMPVLLQALPGMQSMMSVMMKNKMKSKGVASVEELRSLCLEADVKMIACQMTVDLFEFNNSEFIDGIEFGGAATFLGFAGDSDICLFV
ncbi:MAG: NADH dehydrogenase [Gammaproteobacteria bacterium SG8_15]|nr:MAG: NADH dehydrogenase [Gammaproteobacteria bacterium SG8_15]